MKHGAWTPCRKCGHTPTEIEDKAKHVITSDHHFSQADLEGISASVQSGQPLNFNPQQVKHYVEELKNTKDDGNGVGRFLFVIFAVIAVIIVAAIYLIAKLVMK